MIETRGRRWGDDRGSLPLALLASIIVGGLVVSLLATTLAGQRATRFDEDFTAVVQVAEAGANEAIHKIVREGGYVTDATGVAGEGTYAWQIIDDSGPDELDRWLVTSTGELHGVERTVDVVVAELPRFFLAAFADTHLQMRGGNEADSYGEAGWLTGNGVVGSNEDIRLHGNSTGVDAVHLYNWDAYPGEQRCVHEGGDDCDDVLEMPEAIAPSMRIGPALEVGSEQLETEFIGEKLDQCREVMGGGDLESWSTSEHGNVISPTDVLPDSAPEPESEGNAVMCVENFTIAQDTTVTVSTPVEVYVAGDINIGNHVDLNCPTGVGCVAGAGGSFPKSADLQFYVDGGDVNIGNQGNIAAAFYAPTSACYGNGSNAQTEIFGAMTCDQIANQGGWSFHFDDRLKEVGTGHLSVSEWREE